MQDNFAYLMFSLKTRPDRVILKKEKFQYHPYVLYLLSDKQFVRMICLFWGPLRREGGGFWLWKKFWEHNLFWGKKGNFDRAQILNFSLRKNIASGDNRECQED